MSVVLKLPIGIENFEEIRTEDFYYVDKTGLIAELLDNWAKVNLFTRPRRFGKSLNMNMLKYFFSYGCDGKLFDGLKISEKKELCEKYMGKFPVIFITLKDVEGRAYEDAKTMLRFAISQTALQFQFLSESSQLSDKEKAQYGHLTEPSSGRGQNPALSDGVLKNSLLTLSYLLCKHYGQKAILIIDEYDVPLDKAQQHGYYEEMSDLIRSLFGQALKTNDSMYFAILTGCLRIAKESIFTGLNNFKVLSVTNTQFDEHFGFSDGEVRQLLAYYHLEGHYEQAKEWYDGYRFGNADVYCPWDIINYVNMLRFEPHASPKAFWINSSGNMIFRTFLKHASPQTRWELERLVNGECVAKKINQELTYLELYDSVDNLWSVLFTTGYLTSRGMADNGLSLLAIPNLEIRQIFAEQILQWFHEETKKDTHALDRFCAAFEAGDASAIETQLTNYLRKTISIRDTNARKGNKENFYHGILLGLLSHREDWIIDSNAESGDGFSDILVEIEESRIGIVIEVKYVADGDLAVGCQNALRQIGEKGYTSRLLQDGMTAILQYGIACRKKECKAAAARMSVPD